MTLKTREGTESQGFSEGGRDVSSPTLQVSESTEI